MPGSQAVVLKARCVPDVCPPPPPPPVVHKAQTPQKRLEMRRQIKKRFFKAELRSIFPFRHRAPQEFGADVITEDLSEYIAIALLLVHEKAKGKDSFWSSYIGVLPTVEDVRQAAPFL